MTTFPTWPDGERLCAARTPAETVFEPDRPVTLAAVSERRLAGVSGRRDHRTRLEAIQVRDGELRVGVHLLRLRPRATAQLREIAAASLGRAPQSGDELRRGLVLLGDRPVLVRVEDDDVRAVLSDRFVPIDDATLLPMLARAIEAMRWTRNLRARLVVCSESMTIVRLTLRTSRTLLFADDAFERGVQISNSETGACAFTLTPITWRSACWNYALARRPTLRLPHVGAPHRLHRDLRKDIALALHTGRAMLDAWRSSAMFERANMTNASARGRACRARLLLERQAQLLVEDAGDTTSGTQRVRAGASHRGDRGVPERAASATVEACT